MTGSMLNDARGLSS